MGQQEHLAREIADIWADTLGVAQVTLDDDFLDLGGDSVAATAVIMRMFDRFGVEVSFDALFAGCTVSTLVRDYFSVAG